MHDVTPRSPTQVMPAEAGDRGSSPRAADIESADLRDFSRTIAQIDWLLVILVLLYDVYQGAPEDGSLAIYLGTAVFSSVIILVHYLNLVRDRTRWLLASETWVMIVYITWVVYHTGQLHGPLFNLYLLPIVTSALTLGQRFTLLVVGLIAACYLFLGYSTDHAFFSTLTAGGFAAELAPMLLVAYITTMLSADILNAMAKIKLISETDDLTGIFNVRAFNAVAKRDLGLAARSNRPVSVVMVDSDHLKKVNDTHGHDAGDQLIRHVVSCVRDGLRSTDVVARYGGDEFICLLPETGSVAAALVAERIRQRVAKHPMQIGEAVVSTSVSIGIATYPEHGTVFETLTKNADRALYQSKAQGRDRVVVFSPG